MSNKGGRVSPDYLADIAPEYACYATDCLTDYASRREIPISSAVVELKNMGAFPTIYRAARKRAIEPSQNVVSRLIKQGKGV